MQKMLKNYEFASLGFVIFIQYTVLENKTDIFYEILPCILYDFFSKSAE